MEIGNGNRRYVSSGEATAPTWTKPLSYRDNAAPKARITIGGGIPLGELVIGPSVVEPPQTGDRHRHHGRAHPYFVGIYPNYDSAVAAWRGASQARVDEANVKYVIVHLHHLLDPESKTT